MQSELEALYHPPLDPALIAAIANDSDDISQAKAVLDTLQAEAIADGFEDGYISPDLGFSDEDIGFETTEPSTISDTTDAEIGDNENLRFLKLSFPKQSLTTLRFVLQKCHDDVLKSVDELLNHELIDEEKRLNAIVDHGDLGTVDDFFFDGTSKHKKRRQKRQRGMLLQNELDPEVLSSKPAVSRWDQINSDVDWMTRVLSLPKSTVQSAYHSHSSSLPAALNALIEETKWEDCRAAPDHEDNYARMIKSYPALGGNKVKDILNATKEQLPLANEVANVLSAWRPTIGSITSALKHTSIEPKDRARAVAEAVTDETVPSDLTAAECRALAAEYAERRDTAFRQAAAAHQRSKSDALQGGTAMHYAEIGRGFDRRMRSLNLRAAHLSASQRSGGDKTDLDLHGLSVHEALIVVRQGVTAWWATTRLLESSSDAAVSPFRVVTGLGTHSARGEAKLLPAVRKYLEREGWRISVSGGSILVTGVK